MSDLALPSAAWPAAGMVTVGELVRRLAPAPAGAGRSGLGSDPPLGPDVGPQLPIETLLRREGRETGPVPTQPPPSDPPASTSPSGNNLTKIAVAVGAVAAAGSVVAGGLLLSQPSNGGEQGGVEAERGSYPGYPDAAAPDALPPADSLLGGTHGSAFSAAFPDLAAASAAGTIPATGDGAVTPAGSNGAPPSAVPPAADGGAPPASGQTGSATTEDAATDDDGAGGGSDNGADNRSGHRGGRESADDGQGGIDDAVDMVGSAVGVLVGTVGGVR